MRPIMPLLPIPIVLSLFCAVCSPTAPARAQVEGQTVARASETQEILWRRTANGWERADQWSIEEERWPTEQPAPEPLHPLIVAMMQVVVSVGALWAYSGCTKRKPSESGRLLLTTSGGRSSAAAVPAAKFFRNRDAISR